MEAKKSLGQHWLNDSQTLSEISDLADLSPGEVVLEVGSGHGSLTEFLLSAGAIVTAVEIDKQVFTKLRDEASNFYSQDLKNLTLINQDILKFDLQSLPTNYKVVANIPYYLTSHLIRKLVESSNPPTKMVLLVQKEVARRICAKPGQMSVLAISVQLDYDCQLGPVVPAKLFKPPPKVDSQVVILDRHSQPVFENLNRDKFFRLVKAGFSERRKKLRSSLAGGLGLEKDKVDELLAAAGIAPDARAQELSLKQWHDLYKNF